MNIGVVTRVLVCGLFSIVALACGGSDDSAPQTNCGNTQTPRALQLKDVSPAIGASVPNSGIVQTFTVVDQLLQFSPNLALSTAHTAGQPTPTPTKWSITVDGGNTVYTSEPISWASAPAHVELNSLNMLKTDDGCIFALPKQMFNYDITLP